MILARTVTITCEPGFITLQKELENFNGVCTFTAELVRIIKAKAALIFAALTQTKYYRSYCDKFAEYFYYVNIRVFLGEYNLAMQKVKRFSNESATKVPLKTNCRWLRLQKTLGVI